jgi:hypothetical protein
MALECGDLSPLCKTIRFQGLSDKKAPPSRRTPKITPAALTVLPARMRVRRVTTQSTPVARR